MTKPKKWEDRFDKRFVLKLSYGVEEFFVPARFRRHSLPKMIKKFISKELDQVRKEATREAKSVRSFNTEIERVKKEAKKEERQRVIEKIKKCKNTREINHSDYYGDLIDETISKL